VRNGETEMGNQASALVRSSAPQTISLPLSSYIAFPPPSSIPLTPQGDNDAGGKISNFDHNYKVYLKKFVGNYFLILGNRNRKEDEKIEGQLTCKPTCLEIMIDSLRITERKTCVITYNEVC
jgi:hypothetical protein